MTDDRVHRLAIRCCYWLLFARATIAIPVPTREDFLVKGLEELEPAFATFDGTMYAGLLPNEELSTIVDGVHNDSVGEYMFWLFQPNEPESGDSLGVWFNGGPGCSSFSAGLMMENGPVTTELHPAGYFETPEDDSTPYMENPYAWTKVTAMLYVEQPVPVGFSHGGKEPNNETDVGRYFYGFLQNFMDVFPEQRQKRIYLVGESYAGMYIPGVGYYIHQQNKNIRDKRPDRILNLAGLAVGNGWIDAFIQGPAVIDFAWWHGMIDSVTRDALQSEWKHCKENALDSKRATEPSPFHHFTTVDECGLLDAVLEASGDFILDRAAPDIYDATTWDPYRPRGHISSNIRFFNDVKVQELLHVHPLGSAWVGCREGRRRLASKDDVDEVVHVQHSPDSSTRRRLRLLENDRPISVVPYIANLLDDAGIDVLIYSGDRDLSTCLQGSEMALNEMKWSGQSNWMNPDLYLRGLWLGPGPEQDGVWGYAKVVKNLQLLMVYNSGHFVPTNQPKAALDLIRRVVQQRSFVDKVIPVVFKAPPSRQTGWSKDANREETIILVLIAFAFGYATSVLLSSVHFRFFDRGLRRAYYDRVPNAVVRSSGYKSTSSPVIDKSLLLSDNGSENSRSRNSVKPQSGN